MIFVSLTVVLHFIPSSVWAALECTDWEGKSVKDGTDFNPKKEDPCYICRCENGQSTMCKNVSCGAPNCKYWQQIPGKCCQFECLDTPVPGSEMNDRDNYTSSPPSGPNSGPVSDATMTDLGLRLAASTVTTFLILALLLFLLHRLRQKRLRMALRRYSRRRHDLDDSDNASYSPDFFGLQCPPPYEDPPPPYSPPKPRHPHGRDQPPPYDAIDDSGNTDARNMDRNSHLTVDRNGNQSGVTGTFEIYRNSGQQQNEHIALGGAFNFSAAHDLIDPRNLTGRCSERNETNFSTDITNVITSDRIQSQPYSFVQSRTVPRPEIRNELNQNGQVNQCPQTVSDIGESTSSSDSDSSRNSSPVPTEYEDRTQSIVNNETQSNSNVESGVTLSEDAETTVKQFLDKQFGQMAKTRNKNFPASMSQSWTCSEQTSATPHLGLAGSFNRNSGYFQQSPKGISGLARRNDSEISQKSVPKMGLRCGKCNNIIACKCNKVKTNGLLTRSQSDYTQNATNSAPKEAVSVPKSRNLRLLPGSFGARVSYVEPEDTSSEVGGGPDGPQCSSQYHSDSETNISYFTPDMERISPNVSQCDDSEVPKSSRRQELLRELRLSHLLFNPSANSDSSPSPNSPMHTSRIIMPKPKNIQSVNSAFSICTETRRDKRNVPLRPFSGVIDNDVQYPETTFGTVQSSAGADISGPKPYLTVNNDESSKLDTQNSGLNFSCSTLQSVDRMTMVSEEDNTRQYARSHVRHMPKENNSKQNNSDVVESSVHDFSNTVPRESHFGVSSQNDIISNVNTDSSAMKFCNDKDVLKFINSAVPPHLNLMLNNCGTKGVPSVSDRATASQFYNFEHEDKAVRKSKKKLLRKRHSAGSYSGERDPASRKTDVCQKYSPRQKSATLKSKHLRQIGVPDNDQSNLDCLSNGNSVARRQYNQTIDNHRHSPVKVGISPITSNVSPTQHKSSSNKLQPVVSYTNDIVVQNHREGNASSVMMSPGHNSCSTGARLLTKSSCHSDARSQSHHGKKNHKRSKSLGKDECYVGVCVGSRHEEKSPSHKSGSRKKRNRQSFPGTNAFHRELEHVLESQKQAMSFSMAKAVGQQRAGGNGLHAVTQV